MTKQSLLITGSSGYLGQDFISDKRIKKFKVITLDKDQKKQANINIDLNDPNLTSVMIKSFDAGINVSILNLAATRSDYASYDDYITDNIDGTNNFLRSLEIAGINIEMFIHLSSVAVFDGFKLLNKNIDTRNLSSDEIYEYSKAKQEILISEWCKKNGVKLKIIRPSAIFSSNQPRNTNTWKLFSLLKYSPVIFSSPAKKSLTFIKNLIDNIYSSLDSDETGTMLAVEKPILSVNEIQEIILKDRKLFSFKVSVKKTSLLRISNLITRFLGIFVSDPIFTPNRVEKFYKDTSTNLIDGNLDYVQSVCLKEALKKSA